MYGSPMVINKIQILHFDTISSNSARSNSIPHKEKRKDGASSILYKTDKTWRGSRHQTVITLKCLGVAPTFETVYMMLLNIFSEGKVVWPIYLIQDQNHVGGTEHETLKIIGVHTSSGTILFDSQSYILYIFALFHPIVNHSKWYVICDRIRIMLYRLMWKYEIITFLEN